MAPIAKSNLNFMENQLIEPANATPKSKLTEIPQASANSRPGLETGWEVVIGTIIGVISPVEALVEIVRTGSASAMKARTVISVGEKEVGQQAVLAFEAGDLAKPIILGLIKTADSIAKKVAVSADGDRFVVTAEREIELRCGEASITLTRAGKVLIKGEYVLTRAKGVNRIKGAAVSIN
jgi:hypothetical protein